MFTTTHLNTVMKWLVRGLFLAMASFLLFPSAALADKTLTMNVSPAGGGTVSPGASTSHDNNATVNISATPAACYTFVNWTGDTVANANSASTTISMENAARTVTANFIQAGHTITASAGTGGSISPSGATTVCPGANQAFTFAPATGYDLGTYSIDGAAPVSAASGSYTFTNVLANHTISVSFILKSFTITASAGTGGTISPSGATTVNYGDSRSFTITASTGYSIDKVTVDGTDIN
jgi:hypothetical protein